MLLTGFFHSVSYFFPIYRPPSFDAIPSNMDEVFSISPSANVYVFRDFNVDHKDIIMRLTCSGGSDIPGELK